MLKRIAQNVEAEIDDDPTVEVLEQVTRSEKLDEQIEKISSRILQIKVSQRSHWLRQNTSHQSYSELTLK